MRDDMDTADFDAFKLGWRVLLGKSVVPDRESQLVRQRAEFGPLPALEPVVEFESELPILGLTAASSV